MNKRERCLIRLVLSRGKRILEISGQGSYNKSIAKKSAKHQSAESYVSSNFMIKMIKGIFGMHVHHVMKDCVNLGYDQIVEKQNYAL